MVKAVAAVLLVCGLSLAQYTREWQSGNLGYNCWGASYGYDVDGDGIPNMWIRSSGQIVIYKNYSVYWTISFPGYDYPYLVTPRDIDGDGIIKPVNTDGDAAGEVVATAYRISGSDYYGRIRVYDASTKQLEWESVEIAGFVGSATVDDVDGDGKHEIIITRYNYSGNWGYVEVYGYTGQGVGGDSRYVLRRQVVATPSVASGEVRFTLAGGGRTRLVVYDGTGRLVREMLNAEVPAGEYNLKWNGCDESGTRLSAGVYLYRLETEDGTESGRVTLTQP